MREEHVRVFNKVLSREEFRYPGTEMASWSGLSNSQISRFLNGKTDLPSSKFFHLLASMPPKFQRQYWAELLGLRNDRDWRSLVAVASVKDVEEILQAVAERYRSENAEETRKSLALA